MLNQTVLVGRLVDNLTVSNNKAHLKLAVPRSYKNSDGNYDTDYIPCVLNSGIARSALEYCMKGDLVGIKGRVESRSDNDKTIIEIVAEKITFLSSKGGDNNES